VAPDLILVISMVWSEPPLHRPDARDGPGISGVSPGDHRWLPLLLAAVAVGLACSRVTPAGDELSRAVSPSCSCTEIDCPSDASRGCLRVHCRTAAIDLDHLQQMTAGTATTAPSAFHPITLDIFAQLGRTIGQWWMPGHIPNANARRG